jgi:hypothetical protein
MQVAHSRARGGTSRFRRVGCLEAQDEPGCATHRNSADNRSPFSRSLPGITCDVCIVAEHGEPVTRYDFHEALRFGEVTNVLAERLRTGQRASLPEKGVDRVARKLDSFGIGVATRAGPRIAPEPMSCQRTGDTNVECAQTSFASV